MWGVGASEGMGVNYTFFYHQASQLLQISSLEILFSVSGKHVYFYCNFTTLSFLGLSLAHCSRRPGVWLYIQ